jgi:hypothetical protein
MNSLPDRQQAVVLIEESQSNGTRLTKACALLNLSVRTYQRWSSNTAVRADRRPLAPRPEPHNKLSTEEREALLALCNQSEHQSCPPVFIVADQMDQGCYSASESTLYQVLHEHNQVHPRNRWYCTLTTAAR